MNNSISKFYGFITLLFILMSCPESMAQNTLDLSNGQINICWKVVDGQWHIERFEGKTPQGFKPFGKVSGEYSFIYDTGKPVENPVPIVEDGDTLYFPESIFHCVIPDFRRATSAVPMNRAGNYHKFYPAKGYKAGDSVIFEQETTHGNYKAVWSIDNEYKSDILLTISFHAKEEGYYSLPAPTISSITEEDLKWGVVPGFYQGNSIQKSFPLSYAYAQGLPRYPVLSRESTTTTMASIMTNNAGITMAVIPEPGQDRNPYEKERTHVKHWKIALSHMNNDLQLTPMAYHPVLGEIGSFLKKGDNAEFKLRIFLEETDWYTAYKHAIYDIYNLKRSFELKENKKSLVHRLLKQYDYVLDDKTAKWNEELYKDRKIIAQSYQTDVVGADNDAMKNSDIGAVWMLAKLTQDNKFNETRIPYIRNFKVLQQSKSGFFKGAVEGQYYLAKSKRFTEEWGNHFEPVAITYYTMADLGNILLFEPDNKEIKELLKNGAERLLKWQQKDGSWVMAYDRDTHESLYTDLKDYRPTFYGLLIAYKLFGDKKFLHSARKGADWLIENGINNGYFTGVCGDVRFVNDFATIQIACAMYDLYEITSDKRYLDAAIETAKIYTTSIYTHPIPTREIREVKGKNIEDWQLSQIGLNFEHGGSMGSAVHAGPILLSSHCAFFLKLYQTTKDEIFRDFARLAALGKDAFVNEETGVASYYWTLFDNGSGPYPHHAWWQIGWIYDYLLAEAELRSDGRVSFPRGFMTPKVGPHKTTGFAPGSIDNQKANLILRKGLIETDNPNIDYITAESVDGNELFVIFLNNQAKENSFNYKINLSVLWNDDSSVKDEKTNLNSFGYKIVKISKETHYF